MTLRLSTAEKFLRELLKDSINDLRSPHSSIPVMDRMMELDRLRASLHAIEGMKMPGFQTESDVERKFIDERLGK